MDKFFSFKRFVTFGLGLGMFMSAASGFAQTTATATATSGANSYVIDSNGDVPKGTRIEVNAAGVSMSDGKVWIANGNGNINTQGQINVGVGAKTILTADGNIINSGTTQSSNFQTKGDKVYINGTNGNVSTTGTITGADIRTGNIASTGTTDTNKLIVRNGAQITQGGLHMTQGQITNLGVGLADDHAANVGQMKNSIANVKTEAVGAAKQYTDGRIDTESAERKAEDVALHSRIDTEAKTRADADIALDNRKADKTAVADEVKRVDGRIDTEIKDRIKGDADTLNSANVYTNEAVKTEANARIEGDKVLGSAIAGTNVRITQEVTRLDGRIDGVSAALGNEVSERKSEIKRVDGRIDTEAKTRADADIAINKRIDVESTERKADVHNLNNRVDQEVVDRIEGDRQTLESANAHTNNAVSNERDRALAAEAGLNRHINGLGAMTMAANAVAHTANPGDKKTSVGVGVGSYGGETAIAIGATHTRHIEVAVSGEKRPVMVRYGATLSKSRASHTGFGVGASFSF